MPKRYSILSDPKPVIGMIHLDALPGTPAHRQSLRAIENKAVAEAKAYRDSGVHGVMIENMHDTPYLRGGVGPEIVATMAIIARAVRAGCGLPCGIQILAAANREALAVAHAAGLDFIRVEGFAFAHVADEGLIEACAGELLRYRKQIGAEAVQIWADIKKKHSSHAITADLDLDLTAEAVQFMRGDAVIVTGAMTGDAPKQEDVARAKRLIRLPVYLGSGVTPENLPEFFQIADGFIVGSAFKRDGVWSNALDLKRIKKFVAAHGRLSRGK